MNNSNSQKSITETFLTVLLATVLAVLFFIHADINIGHYNARINADIASETLLGPVIYENGFRTPSTWYSSTGVRIISPPVLASFIYPLTGNNMNLAQGISCIIFGVVLIALMLIYLKQLNLGTIESLAAAVIILSSSRLDGISQSILFCWASYYASYFIVMLIILIIYNISLKNGRVPVAAFILSSLLSYLAGLQGMHTMLYCHLPLLGVEIVRLIAARLHAKNKKANAGYNILLWLIIQNIIYYLGSRVYKSMATSRNIRHAREKFLSEVWPSMTGVISFEASPILMAVFCCISAAGFILVIISLLFGKKNTSARTDFSDTDPLWSSLSFVAAFVLWIISSTFTTTEVAPRYFIVEIFILGIGTALFLNIFAHKKAFFLAIPVAIIGILTSVYFYNGLIKGDKSKESDEYAVAAWMEENGYEYGYATFDYANVLTVISNDKVKVRALDSMEKLNGCKWLTDSNWYPPVKNPDGPTCYIVTSHTESDLQKFIKENNPQILNTDTVGKYIIYVFDKDYSKF